MTLADYTNTANSNQAINSFQVNAPLIINGQFIYYNSSDQDLLRSLDAYDFTSIRDEVRLKSTNGTCKWILGEANFRDWALRKNSNLFLWISGIPGSGKSYLAHYICQQFGGKKQRVLYFFFDSKVADRSSLQKFYPTVLYQLLQQVPRSSQELRAKCFDIVHRHINGDTETPSLGKEKEDSPNSLEKVSEVVDDAFDILDDSDGLLDDTSDPDEDSPPVKKESNPLRDSIRDILAILGPAFLVVDALDECIGTVSEVLKEWLEDLRAFSQLKVVITSRPSGIIQEISENLLDLHLNLSDPSVVEKSNADIRLYIKTRIRQSKLLPSPMLELPERLEKKSSGMILYARLTLDILETVPADEQTLLRKLNELPAGLGDLYAHRLNQISDQPETTEFVNNIFRWLVNCKRPPTLDALRAIDAICRRIGETNSFEPDGQRQLNSLEAGYFRNHVLSLCLPLVEIVGNEHNGILRFVHTTIPQFLKGENLGGKCEPCPDRFLVKAMESHEFIAITCVTYLRWRFVDSELLNYQDLHEYAVLEWPDHGKSSEELLMRNEKETQALVSFCKGIVFENWLVARAGSDNLFRVHFALNGQPIHPKPLHIAVYFNIWQLALLFLEDVNTPDATGATPLHIAAGRSPSKIVSGLMEKGALPNIRDHAGSLPLHRAVRGKNLDAVSALLEKGEAEVNVPDKYKLTPLHIACQLGWTKCVKLLLSHHADPLNDSGGAETPIGLAIENGHFEVTHTLLESNKALIAHCAKPLIQAARKGWLDTVKFLFEKGADATYKDWGGQTALHKACIAQNNEMVKYLLEKKLSPDPVDNSQRTPLYFAAERGSLHVVNSLLEHGADYNSLDRRRETPLFKPAGNGHIEVVKRLLDAGTDATILDFWDRTPLRFAGMKGRVDIVRVLLERTNIDLNLPDWDGRTVLHAASAFLREGQEEVIDLLIQHGAQADKLEKNRKGTALHAAIFRVSGQPKPPLALILRLIHHKVPLDVRDQYGRTALYLAAQTQNVDVVKILLDAGASQREDSFLAAIRSGNMELVRAFFDFNPPIDVSWRGWNDITALHIAASLGHHEIVAQLLALGAPTQCLNMDKMTPLLCAEENGHRMTVELLRQADTIPADYDSRVEVKLWGRNILHWAAEDGEYLSEEMLNDSDLNIQDVTGRTPLHLAVCSGSHTTVKQLLAAQARTDLSDTVGQTPLHYAAERPHGILLHAIMATNANVNVSDRRNRTPLHLAAREGNTEAARALLKANAQLQADYDSQTPLSLAVANGHDETVRTILEFERTRRMIARPDSDGRSTLHVAARHGRDSLVQYLLECTSEAAVVDMLDKTGQTALHLAAKHGHAKVVRLLLGAGALAYRTDKERFMAMHHAAAAGYTAIVELLLDAIPASVQKCLEKWDNSLPNWASKEDGADNSFLEVLYGAKALVQRPGSKFWTTALDVWLPENRSILSDQIIRGLSSWDKEMHSIPGTILFQATLGGHTDTARRILEKVPYMPLEVSFYANPQVLSVAAREGHEEIVALLIKAGSDVTAITDAQVTSLHDAADRGHASIVEMLLQHGANPDIARLRDGSTPLHLAADGGYADAVRVLVNMAFVDAADDLGKTALHLACSKGHEVVVELLLDANASVIAQDLEKKTPLTVVNGLSDKIVLKLQAQAELQKLRQAVGQ